MLNFLFLFLAIFGIALSAYAYKKSKRDKRLVFKRRSSKIISKKDFSYPKLTFQYDGNDVENLMMTEISIWNHGTEPFKAEDFVTTDCLRIECSSDTFIYDFQMEVVNEHNKIRAEQASPMEVRFDFVYLNSYEGMKVIIFHSGTDSEDIDIKGRFIGAEAITKAPPKGRYISVFFDSKFFVYTQNLINKIRFTPLKFIAILVLVYIQFPIVILAFILLSPFDYLNDSWERKMPEALN